MDIMLFLNIILWILIVIFSLICLLLILPISIELHYDGDKFDFKIKLWFLRVDTLVKQFPKKKNKKIKKDSKKQSGGEKLKDIKSAAKYVKAFIGTSGKMMKMIIKSIVFKRINLKIVVGSEEASQTATNYGILCAAVYPAASAFVECNEPENYDISVVPDFISEKTRIFIDLKLRARIINLLIVAIKLFRIITNKLK